VLWFYIAAGVTGLLFLFLRFGKKWAKKYQQMTATLRSYGLTVNQRPPLVASGMAKGVSFSIGVERRTTTIETVYDVIAIRATCQSPLPNTLAHRRNATSVEFQSTMGFRAVQTGVADFDGQFKTLVADDEGAALWKSGALGQALVAIADPDTSSKVEDFRISANEAVLSISPAWLTASLARQSIDFLIEVATQAAKSESA
jgi:hypothetical protein